MGEKIILKSKTVADYGLEEEVKALDKQMREEAAALSKADILNKETREQFTGSIRQLGEESEKKSGYIKEIKNSFEEKKSFVFNYIDSLMSLSGRNIQVEVGVEKLPEGGPARIVGLPNLSKEILSLLSQTVKTYYQVELQLSPEGQEELLRIVNGTISNTRIFLNLEEACKYLVVTGYKSGESELPAKHMEQLLQLTRDAAALEKTRGELEAERVKIKGLEEQKQKLEEAVKVGIEETQKKEGEHRKLSLELEKEKGDYNTLKEVWGVASRNTERIKKELEESLEERRLLYNKYQKEVGDWQKKSNQLQREAADLREKLVHLETESINKEEDKKDLTTKILNLEKEIMGYKKPIREKKISVLKYAAMTGVICLVGGGAIVGAVMPRVEMGATRAGYEQRIKNQDGQISRLEEQFKDAEEKIAAYREGEKGYRGEIEELKEGNKRWEEQQKVTSVCEPNPELMQKFDNQGKEIKKLKSWGEKYKAGILLTSFYIAQRDSLEQGQRERISDLLSELIMHPEKVKTEDINNLYQKLKTGK